MILDTGATKTVSAEFWMKHFLDLLLSSVKKKVQRRKENRIFRFGNSVRYPSREELIVPIKVGTLDTVLYVSVVSANIPLLLGKAT